MPGKAQESDDDYHEEIPDSWLEKVRSGERIISYNVRKEERPGGIKVRFKIGVVSGERTKEIDAPGKSDHGCTGMGTAAASAARPVTATRPAK